MLKEAIYYHRSYRKESITKKDALVQLFLLLSPAVVVLFTLPDITYYMAKSTEFILNRYFDPVGAAKIIKSPFAFSDLYAVHIPALIHTPEFYFVFFGVSFGLLLVSLITLIFRSSPVALYIFYILAINAISAAYFALAPLDFPYNMDVYSDLYIRTEAVIWLVIPFLFTIALIPFPSNLFFKFLITIVTLLYSMTFSLVRYILFLYVLEKFSYIFMATFFFAFGPLLDFIYIVAIYSYFLNVTSRKYLNSNGKGQWIY